jgi:hypothetical protein
LFPLWDVRQRQSQEHLWFPGARDHAQSHQPAIEELAGDSGGSMSLKEAIQQIVDLIRDVEGHSAIVRFAVWEGEFIATVEVYDNDGEDHPLLYAAEKAVHDEQLSGFYIGLIKDLAELARNVRERGEVRSQEGHGQTPEEAAIKLFEALRDNYNELVYSISKDIN